MIPALASAACAATELIAAYFMRQAALALIAALSTLICAAVEMWRALDRIRLPDRLTPDHRARP